MAQPIQRQTPPPLLEDESTPQLRQTGIFNGRNVQRLSPEDEVMIDTLSTCMCLFQTIIVFGTLLYVACRDNEPE